MTLIQLLQTIYAVTGNSTYVFDADGTADVDEYKEVHLGRIDCTTSSGTLDSALDFYNCKRCGNDKYYCQPAVQGEYLQFAFSERDSASTDIKAPDFGYGDAGSGLFSAKIYSCDGAGEKLIADVGVGGDFNMNAYNAWDCDTQSSFQFFRVSTDSIFAWAYAAGYCCFYIKFEFYTAAGNVVKTLYSEQYCLSGCYDALIEAATPLFRCSAPFLDLENDLDYTTHVKITLSNGTIIEKDVLITDLTADALCQALNMDSDFNVYGVYYTVPAGLGVTGFVLISQYTMTAVVINGHVPKSPIGCVSAGNTATDTYRFCCISTALSGIIFPFSGDITLTFSDGAETELAVSFNNLQVMYDWLETHSAGHGVLDTQYNVIDGRFCWLFHNNGFPENPTPMLEMIDDELNTWTWSITGTCPVYAPLSEVTKCYNCDDTVQLRGIYPKTDCFNQRYQKPSSYCDTTNYLGDDIAYQLLVRVKGKVTLTGHTIEKTENEKGVVTKTRKWFNYELKGSPIPEYVASQLALVCAAPSVVVDGITLLFDGSSITKDITYSNMWRLSIKFKSEVCENKFLC